MARSFPPERCEPSARTLTGCYDRVRSSTSPQTVSHVPDCGLMQPQQAATSFDHLVGAHEECGGHVRNETAFFHIIIGGIRCRQFVLSCERDNELAMDGGECASCDNETAILSTSECADHPFDLTGVAHIQRTYFDAE